MKDTISHTPDGQQRNLRTKFVRAGLLTILLLCVLLTSAGYYTLRYCTVESTADRISTALSMSLYTKLKGDPLSSSTADGQTRLAKLGGTFKHLSASNSVLLMNKKRQVIWSSKGSIPLTANERVKVTALFSGQAEYQVFDHSFVQASTWLTLLTNEYAPLTLLVRVKNNDGQIIGVAKLLPNMQPELRNARNVALLFLILVLLGNLLLFWRLKINFENGIKMIEEQEEELNLQVARLSKLLTENKLMQDNIRTASARAVELNEQFLRRVGADLHDGPAQMIGFANLRLNKISKMEEAKLLGHEFHAVKEALEESLDEIRGISSGLVLPELEGMSLEQCLRKVTVLHSAKSEAEIDQYYQDVPNDLALPIKICAYRFVQEGLNNAERHGKATKCRLSSYIKNNKLYVSLKDNGCGFRVSQLRSEGVHLGLMGLKDRIESLGGTFSINSELGVGTALKFSIQITEESA